MLINNKTIIKDNDPLIRRKSEKVALPLSNEDETLLREMYEYVKNSTDEELAKKLDLRPAVGLSAIQVGVPKQLTAIILHDLDANGNEIVTEYMLANPRIVSKSVQPAYLQTGEGCLSVDQDHQGFVVRHARVTVKGYDLIQDKEITIRARGYLAIVLQHELDHFDGTLFYDHIDPKQPYPLIRDAMVI